MDKYLHHTPEDFAAEDSFISWVKNKNASDIKFWDIWVKEHPSKMAEINQAKELVSLLKFTTTKTTAEVKQRVWANIDANTVEHDAPMMVQPSGSSIIRIVAPLAIAASLALLLYFNFGQSESFDTKVSTEIAMVNVVNLPDGSKVYVNAESHLSYDQSSWTKSRNLFLEGEAFFDVKKGSTFTVSTATGEVQVLGTSFNVYARSNMLEVECKTGKVKVTSGDHEKIINPGESVKSPNQTPFIFTNNLTRSNWHQEEYRYKNELFKWAIEDIKRKFDVTINTTEDIEDIKFTGRFTGSSLDSVLYQICWPLGLDYSIDGKSISITK